MVHVGIECYMVACEFEKRCMLAIVSLHYCLVTRKKMITVVWMCQARC